MLSSQPARALLRVLLGVLVVLLAFVGFASYLAHGDMAAAARLDMRGDLRNVASAESLYFETHHTFTSELADLHLKPNRRVDLSIDRADSTAWHATAAHRRSTELCDIGGSAGGAVAGPRCR
jgi:hypothetical protein